ncbi:hypothetical protein GCM10010912_31680 [Paenibacillus albidus]|uniref:Uncharacterized protein n=1 Tax=Paenibacillus albidus TaxID=2041023 RepID=A0A917FJR2_9BACL|nr:hypothetical protein [Paenibacillus albidus]GGF84127.1 hypothetical protein GCM10010912_31680 [Paenibacillus albidus]
MTNPEGRAPFTDPGDQKPDPGAAPRQNSVSDQWNTLLKDERVQQARQVSKQYFGFFLGTLASPYRTMKAVGAEQALHAVITMALTALLSAFYFLAWFIKWDISPVFASGFLQPLLLSALGIAAAVGLAYAVLKIERVTFDPKLMIARFGTLLIPAVALLVLAILFLVVGLFSLSISLLVISFLFIFVALNTVLFQYQLSPSGGRVDTTYLIVIANAVTGYIFYKLISSVIVGAIGNFFGGSPFGM